MLSPLYGQLSPLRVPTSMRRVSDDNDANAYLLAVERADGQELESGVISAVESFITGCKSDGIWTALKASCILAGARTLSGALVPLVGTAPTSANFVSGDYNRKTGLIGDGSTKYLNANRNHNLDAQNSNHAAVWATSISTTQQRNLYGAANTVNNGSSIQIYTNTSYRLRNRSANSVQSVSNVTNTGLQAFSRSTSASYTFRSNSTDYTINAVSAAPASSASGFFASINVSTPSSHTASRVSFYSIGQSIDLAALDTRVSTLMTAIAAAIP
jgi:hypothetical protein